MMADEDEEDGQPTTEKEELKVVKEELRNCCRLLKAAVKDELDLAPELDILARTDARLRGLFQEEEQEVE